MTRLSYRTRLFLALFAVSAIPVALISVAGIVYINTLKLTQSGGYVDDLKRTWETTQREFAAMDAKGDSLSPGARFAVERHNNTLDAVVGNSMRAERLGRNMTAGGPYLYVLSAVILLFGVGIVGVTLSRQFSAPLDEVVDWTELIQRHDELPSRAEQRGIPEFNKLQSALRDLQRGLEQARLAELESERLRTFGEVARRVAHEMKNPLTPIRLAVLQLSRTATPESREVLDIIAVESSRLEAMAREFAELGRLPEGVAAPVDLQELIVDLLRSTVPESMTHELVANGALPEVEGYYDPLRRAFSNVLRNAVEACKGSGHIRVVMGRVDHGIAVQISDNGPGIPADKREQIFQPYYTEKGDGTGLGLAIVRQTIEQHHGTIAVTETPGGGATFLVRFPA